MKVNVTIKNSSNAAEVAVRKNGEVLTDIWSGNLRIITDESLAGTIRSLRALGWSNLRKATDVWTNLRDKFNEADVSIPLPPGHPYAGYTSGGSTVVEDGTPVDAHEASPAVPAKDFLAIVKKWKNFMSEFNFVPQARFLNSLARMKKASEVKDYVIGYFALTNNSYLNDLKEKVKSSEFSDMADEIVNSTNKVINERLEILYGAAGGGKTTTAIKENPTAKVVVCHSNMTPDELFRGFYFEEIKDKDGNTIGSCPVFRGCALQEAMTEGRTVILDEINLLTMECLRTLQAVCDCKEAVTIGDEVIKIKPGFKVVGTMNLVVDEQVFGLPGPLVDRCSKIAEFEMSDKRLAEIAF